MIRFVDDRENVLYRLKKSKFPIFFMVIFMPIWLYFAAVLLSPSLQALKSGNLPMDQETWLAGLISLALMLPIMLLIAMSYALGNLVITDKRVYIRRGISGRTYIVDHAEIISFQHVISRGKNSSNHAILLYLRNGKQVRSGNLNSTLGSLQQLLEVLRGKFEGKGYTRDELRQMSGQNIGSGPDIRINPLVIVIFIMPWLLAILLTAINYLT